MRFESSFANWLQGVRVLDFTAVLAGPHLTRVLAQAGAEVIKIEAIPTGDTTRGLPYRYGGSQSGYFKQQNLGKLSLALNLANEEGHGIAMRLAAQSQIVVENFRPGIVERLGVGYTDIVKVRPDIVYVSISGWGQTGPYARMTGEVRSTTALSGLMAPDTTGHAPGWERCSFGDTNASLHGVAAIGAGLRRARKTGRSTYVDLSILEALMSTNCLELPEVLDAGGGLAGTEFRTGPDHARVASGVFQSSDASWTYIRAVKPAAWRALATLIGIEALADLPMPERRGRAGEIYAALATFCARQTQAALRDQLRRAGIAATQVRSVKEALADETTSESGLVQEVPDAHAGSVPVPTGLFATASYGRAPQEPEPLLGQNSHDVLTRLLGYSDREVLELANNGVIQLDSTVRLSR